MRRLALFVAVITAALAVASVPAAGGEGRVSYRPPVDGPIVDPFRPPPEEWLAGNRGIDYAPPPGTPVRAAAAGEVTFAGQVGGPLHVVVLHADGIRTSYSFLDTIAVHRGERVRQGQIVGTTGDELHFGARVGDDYIDPRTLFDTGPPHVFLVPDDVRRPGSEAEEKRGLARFLDFAKTQAGRIGGELIDQAKAEVMAKIDEALGVVQYAKDFSPITHVVRFGQTLLDYYEQRGDCTSAGVEPPPAPQGRVAVLVGGMGSTSGDDSIDHVDAAGLGYADHTRFSYLGGSTDQNPYSTRDTTTDLVTEGERFRDFLAQVHREHPGMAVDIIAHSQGGIIAREALEHHWDATDPSLPQVANLVTLATPHQGTDIATALTMIGHTEVGGLVMDAVDAFHLTPTDLTGDSVAQLAEHSIFMWKLNHTPLPKGVRLTSIGSRTDIMVPAIHTRAPGGRNVVVDVPGLASDHSKLPGSVEGRREVALAVAGMPPTCQSLSDMMADTAVSDLISLGEDAAGAGLYAAGRSIDDKLEGEEPDPNDAQPPTTHPPDSRPR